VAIGVRGVQKVRPVAHQPSLCMEYTLWNGSSSPYSLFFLARCSRNQLIRQIEFLKAENEMLRQRISKYGIRTTPAERRRLISWGRR